MATQRIVAPPARASVFLALDVHDGAEDAVREVLTGVSGLTRAVGFRERDADLGCVIGIGSGFWDRLVDGPRPAQLHPFRELVGPRHTAPSTQCDLLVHIRSRRTDVCFELARLVVGALADHAEVTDEVHGFTYFDERDLLGFVDGTENPEGEAAHRAGVIGPEHDEDPLFAGGSYVIVQKYVHDMAAWQALSTEEQERVIGRTKLDDVELDDAVKPANSHVALNDIDGEDGAKREIIRYNMPFGTVGAGEYGTYFIGYAADADTTEQMLRNMFLGDPPGNTDRILDFSTALTGGLYFVPSPDLLDSLDDLPAAGAGGAVDDDETDGPGPGPRPAGSLGIGSLRP